MSNGNRSVRGKVVTPGLAVGHDDQPAARDPDLSGISEGRAKQNRAHDVVKSHGGDDDGVQSNAPARVRIQDEACESNRDAGGGQQADPHSRHRRLIQAGNSGGDGCGNLQPEETNAATASAARPTLAIASILIAAPIAANSSTTTGVAPSRMASSSTLRASSLAS
jgi:hypothetical protein